MQLRLNILQHRFLLPVGSRLLAEAMGSTIHLGLMLRRMDQKLTLSLVVQDSLGLIPPYDSDDKLVRAVSALVEGATNCHPI